MRRLRRAVAPARRGGAAPGGGAVGGEMLTAIDKVLFLMRAGITAEASTDALSRLAAAAHDTETARGERLFSPGDDADALYIVLDGAIRVEVEDASPRLA